jgi:hypothetical protein
VIDSHAEGGSFPKYREGTELFIGGSEETFEDESEADSESYPWSPQSSSRCCSQRKRRNKIMPGLGGHGQHWKKLQQEDENMLEKEAPVLFSNIRVMTPEVLNMNGGSNPSTKTTQEKSTKITFVMPSPPVIEIVNRERSNTDEVSDVSSLVSDTPSAPSYDLAAPTSNETLEYSLEKGAEGWSPAMVKASASIIQELEASILQQSERDTQMLENVSKTPTKTDVASKCLMLLMNPRSKLFEIIQVSFSAERATVGDILRGIRDVATDPRLAHQTYTGLAYQGMHISAMVPVDMIVEAQTNGKPLLAVPRNFSAGEIERMASELLGRPQVLQLLESQNALC